MVHQKHHCALFYGLQISDDPISYFHWFHHATNRIFIRETQQEFFMRILIINPPWPGKGFGTRSQNRIIKHRSDKFLQYPIFLAYSAAQLKQAGHEVRYIDSVIQDLDLQQTLACAKSADPDVIFMETTTPSIEADYQNLTALKAACGSICEAYRTCV